MTEPSDGVFDLPPFSETTQSGVLPLFPLKSVLFPKGRLPLQIFEQRYLDMIRRAMRAGTGFGICLLREGEEVARAGTQQQVHRVGTFVQIVDWDQLPNGLLGLTVEARCKFEVLDCRVEKDQLLVGHVARCATDHVGEPPVPVSADHEVLVSLLEQLVSHPVITRLDMQINYEDARELGWRLGELIPLRSEQKQALLELQDPLQRLQDIEAALHRLMDENP
jgi:Lon protease-like protein